jgi:RNA polymerase sigma-70 factor (ECF subfamily)
MNNIEVNLPSDALLLIQLQQGNKQAFNILYKKYWAQVYSNAYNRLRDSDQAKEIVQEIFVNIWIRRENPIMNFQAYLIGAVRNEVFKLASKQKNTVPFIEMGHEIIANHGQADSNIEYQEFYKAYEAVLKTIPPKKQMIFRLRFHEDLSTKEIADQLGITRKTVQNQLGRAIEQLRLKIRFLF